MKRDLTAAMVPREWDDLKPIRGRLKSRAADFRVEEVLGFGPEGHGDYLWVDVEKTGLSMGQLFHELGEGLGIRAADIGHAGLKDRTAVTRQTLSMPAGAAKALAVFSHEKIRINGWLQNPGPIHVGQLRGNRFEILLRGQNQARLEDAQEWGRRLTESGAPNGFGRQRFGRNLDTLRLGLAMIREELSVSRMGRMNRRLAISSVQSWLFNLYLISRMKKGRLRTVMGGDILQHRGKSIQVQDVSEAQAEYDRGDLRITGPLFGGEGGRATGEAGCLEQEVLTEAGLSIQHFQRFQYAKRGVRRPLVVVPSDLTVEEDDHGLRFSFFLPRGCYATEVLGQLMKRPW